MDTYDPNVFERFVSNRAHVNKVVYLEAGSSQDLSKEIPSIYSKIGSGRLEMLSKKPVLRKGVGDVNGSKEYYKTFCT